MPTAVIPVVIKRESLVYWQTANPILLWGELGVVHTSNASSRPRMVVGDGVSTFNYLYDNTRFFLTYEDLNQNYLTPIVVSLTALITAESNARLAGDNANASLINGLADDVDNLSDSLDLTDAALATETENRISGDAGLQTQIDSIAGTIETMNGAVIFVGGVSGEAFSRGDLVIINAGGVLYKYDYSDVSHRNAIFGLAVSNADSDGLDISVHLFGVFIMESALFNEGATMYASQSVVGGLTNAEPTGVGAVKVGYAINDLVINVNIEIANNDAVNLILSDLINEDAALYDAINAEASDRATEDSTLQTNIDNEEATRITEDANLQSQISALTKFISYTIGAQNTTRNDNAILFWGQSPVAPEIVGGRRRIYVDSNCTIKKATIANWSLTAGTGENWSMYIRVNDTTDTLIQTIGVAANHRKWTNTSLSISLNAGDYFEIKEVCPAWATNPVGTQMAGNILIQI